MNFKKYIDPMVRDDKWLPSNRLLHHATAAPYTECMVSADVCNKNLNKKPSCR